MYQPQPQQYQPYTPYQPNTPYNPNTAYQPVQSYQPFPPYNPEHIYGQPQPPITNQPINVGQDPGGYTPVNLNTPHYAAGLNNLISIDRLLVKQKVELLEVFTGFETNNKFTIKNDQGQKIFWAIEETDCCTRNLCGPARAFDMKILDAQKNQVIHLNRPLRCSSCLFPCFLQEMEVTAPPGTLIGSIKQNWSFFPSFEVTNETGTTVLKIEGPICTYAICGQVEFKILTLDGDQVGKISKQWSGLARELFTDADFFGIEFPMDLDVKMKAVMLGACFLIDAMFFEKHGHLETDGPGML